MYHSSASAELVDLPTCPDNTDQAGRLASVEELIQAELIKVKILSKKCRT